jgi:hypothetical protein
VQVVRGNEETGFRAGNEKMLGQDYTRKPTALSTKTLFAPNTYAFFRYRVRVASISEEEAGFSPGMSRVFAAKSRVDFARLGRPGRLTKKAAKC